MTPLWYHKTKGFHIMEKMKVIDLHKHGFETSEFYKANLTPHQFLLQHLAMANIYNFDFYAPCGSHNSTTWGKQVWEEYQRLQANYKENLHIYPFAEYNVNIGPVVTYKDKTLGDDKYIFKKMHVLAFAKKGKESEFFKKTRVYSAWSDMYINKNSKSLVYDGNFPKNEDSQKDYIEIGTYMKAARNIVCDNYNLTDEQRIPFDIYENTITRGLTYEEIRDRFIDDTFDYLVEKGKIKNTNIARQVLEKVVSNYTNKIGNKKITIFKKFDESDLRNARCSINPNGFFPGQLDHSFSRLDMRDFSLLFGDTAYLCVAHPNTIELRKYTDLPVSIFEGVDISTLPNGIMRDKNDNIMHDENGKEIYDENFDEQKLIRKTLNIYRQNPNVELFFDSSSDHTVVYKYENNAKKIVLDAKLTQNVITQSGKLEFVNGDFSGVVKDEIFIKNLDKYAKKHNFNIDAYEISPAMWTSNSPRNNKQEFAWSHFDLYAKYGKAVNSNSALGDLHMQSEKTLDLIDPSVHLESNETYRDKLNYACCNCSMLDLLETGTFDKKNQELDVRVLKGFKKSKSANSSVANNQHGKDEKKSKTEDEELAQ